ncbi:hypothetical protein R3P38DRAFT_2809059 [Favolaschia claudopus]|uniref:Uncharacterized protein n=1 Tax=Favolaschia claudopus TaxID=2862362 RepID=A0AAV9Z0B2_9AGAR
MGQTRAVLVNPTSAVLEEQFLRDHHAWNFANPRPSIVQYPASTAATAGSEPSSPTNQLSDDGFPSPVLVAPPPSPDPKYIGTRSSQDFDGAFVRTFDPANPMLALDSVAGDPLLRTLLHMKLGPALHQLTPSAEHIVPILREGTGGLEKKNLLPRRRLLPPLRLWPIVNPGAPGMHAMQPCPLRTVFLDFLDASLLVEGLSKTLVTTSSKAAGNLVLKARIRRVSTTNARLSVMRIANVNLPFRRPQVVVGVASLSV